MPRTYSRPLTFPMNKAEYISALYNTLASIGHEAAIEGRYSQVIPRQVEQKLLHLKSVMDWLNDGVFGYDRIEINDEGEVAILPKKPQTLLEVFSELDQTFPYHKLPAKKGAED
jgi:hypothetical protein